jgi:UDPglucose 6-dehydrogenase
MTLLSFRPTICSCRESAAIYVCKYLLEEGAELAIYDPKVKKDQIDRDLKSVVDEGRGRMAENVLILALLLHGRVRLFRRVRLSFCVVFAFYPRARPPPNAHLRSLSWHPAVDKLVTVCKTSEEAMDSAHGIVVLTEWDEFKDIDYAKAYASMPKPAYIFDGRLILDHAKLRSIGFEVEVIGKSA